MQTLMSVLVPKSNIYFLKTERKTKFEDRTQSYSSNSADKTFFPIQTGKNTQATEKCHTINRKGKIKGKTKTQSESSESEVDDPNRWGVIQKERYI